MTFAAGAGDAARSDGIPSLSLQAMKASITPLSNCCTALRRFASPTRWQGAINYRLRP